VREAFTAEEVNMDFAKGQVSVLDDLIGMFESELDRRSGNG